VSRSVIRWVSKTVPWDANASRNSLSVTLKSRFPTNNFVLIKIQGLPGQFHPNHAVPVSRVSNPRRAELAQGFPVDRSGKLSRTHCDLFRNLSKRFRVQRPRRPERRCPLFRFSVGLNGVGGRKPKPSLSRVFAS